MTQVNMLEAKTELSRLIRLLETKQEDIVLIARNGEPVAQITLYNRVPEKKRLGIAKAKFKIPKDFDSWDGEVEEMFGELS